MHEQQTLAADRQLAPLRLAGEPLREHRIDAGAGAGAGTVRAKETLLMIADDDLRIALLQEAHDLVREPVLVNAVAKTDQLVDIAHQGERLCQSGRVAMNVRDNTQPHSGRSINVERASSRKRQVTIIL